MRRFLSPVAAALLVFAALAVLFLGPPALQRINAAHLQTRITLAQHAIDSDDILARLDAAVTAVADRVLPSVVHIDVRRRPNGNVAPGGIGSGWLYDEQGHVVTNAHVVRGADSIAVQLHDGRFVDASVVGIDTYTDIAVLRVRGTPGLFPMPRATGERPRQGQRVFAFGSPFGFKFSMSEGIISAVGRDPAGAREFGGFTNFLQTDAAVNPGNSGGPLVDIRGRLVGMNVAIATGRDTQGTTEGDSAGISFAIPLATIESIAEQIIASGRVSRGFLGITFGGDAVGEPTADGRTLVGVRISDVTAGGPSDRAGLRPGDLITALDGQPVPRFQVLRAIVSTAGPGRTLRVTVLRGRETRDIDVTLGEMPRELLALQAVQSVMVQTGVLFAEGPSGVMIERVWPGMAGDTQGFAAGQRVVSAAGKAVSDLTELFVVLLDEGLLTGSGVPVMVVTPDGSRKTVTMRLENF